MTDVEWLVWFLNQPEHYGDQAPVDGPPLVELAYWWRERDSDMCDRHAFATVEEAAEWGYQPSWAIGS